MNRIALKEAKINDYLHIIESAVSVDRSNVYDLAEYRKKRGRRQELVCPSGKVCYRTRQEAEADLQVMAKKRARLLAAGITEHRYNAIRWYAGCLEGCGYLHLTSKKTSFKKKGNK